MPNLALAPRRAAVIVSAAFAVLALAPAPAFAASVRVSPTSGLDPAGQTITVTGAGFDPDRNNGFGVYVVFGPRGPDWATNANAYQAAKWVHRGAAASGGQAPMSASGGFSVSLSVKARYTDGDGKKVDCTKTQCYVLTMAAHGVPDRSQDTSTPIRFKGAGSGGSRGSSSSGGSGGAPGSTGSGTGDHGSAPVDAGASGAAASPASGTPSASAAPRESLDAAPAGDFEQAVSGGRAGSAWPFLGATAAAVIAVVAARQWGRRRAVRRKGA